MDNWMYIYMNCKQIMSCQYYKLLKTSIIGVQETNQSSVPATSYRENIDCNLGNILFHFVSLRTVFVSVLAMLWVQLPSLFAFLQQRVKTSQLNPELMQSPFGLSLLFNSQSQVTFSAIFMFCEQLIGPQSSQVNRCPCIKS